MESKSTTTLRSKRGRHRAIEISAFAALLLVVGVAMCGGERLLAHLWNSVGFGSSVYRECYELVKADVGNLELRDVEKQNTADGWSYRFEYQLLTGDNSPAGEGVRRCETKDGTASLVGY